jgi:hypothetical protein
MSSFLALMKLELQAWLDGSPWCCSYFTGWDAPAVEQPDKRCSCISGAWGYILPIAMLYSETHSMLYVNSLVRIHNRHRTHLTKVSEAVLLILSPGKRSYFGGTLLPCHWGRFNFFGWTGYIVQWKKGPVGWYRAAGDWSKAIRLKQARFGQYYYRRQYIKWP